MSERQPDDLHPDAEEDEGGQSAYERYPWRQGADQPPSVLLVLYVLYHEGEMTQSPLAEETRLSGRTVRWAVDRAEGEGLVEREKLVQDYRKSVHRLTDAGEQYVETGGEADV